METLHCSRCKQMLPVEAFANNSNNKNRHGKEHYCKSCNKERKQKYYTENKDKVLTTIKKRKPEARLYDKARNRAIARGLEFNLTPADIVIPEVCPILGIPLGRRLGEAHAGSPSLDRIDNSKGYIKENIWVISLRANRLKSDASIKELKQIVAALEAIPLGIDTDN